MSASAENAVENRGQLFVVATPIGNLQDFTMRAIEVLQSVDIIAAEDTRHSRKLFTNYGIKTPCVSLHEHNEREQLHKLGERLRQGQRVALISDAGTPLISDPGYQLVKHCLQIGVRVVPIPGPSALIAALSAAGLASDRFCFEGFAPAKSAARLQSLALRRHETATLIYYLSPHRWRDTLSDMIQVFGAERSAVLAREITKLHEIFHQDTLGGLLQWMDTHAEQQKGEMVLLLAGAVDSIDPDLDQRSREWLSLLLKELPPSRAAAVLAEMLGVKKKVLYQLALSIQNAE